MALLLTPAQRRERVERAADRVGGKAELGRLLGYKDGAFVGQMIRGTRPVTEKTLRRLLEIRSVADLFSWSAGPAPGVAVGFVMAGNDEAAAPAPALAQPTAQPPPTQPTQISLADALPVVLDALLQSPTARWASVRAQLDQLMAHPEMRDDVLGELLPLLEAPPAKHQSRA